MSAQREIVVTSCRDCPLLVSEFVDDDALAYYCRLDPHLSWESYFDLSSTTPKSCPLRESSFLIRLG